MKRTIGLWAAIIFVAIRAQAGDPVFTNVIHYTAPTNFCWYVGETRMQRVRDPISRDFVECHFGGVDNWCNQATFRVGLIGADANPLAGTITRTYSADAAGLKEELEEYYRIVAKSREHAMERDSSAEVSKINGRITASLTALEMEGNNPYQVHFCWIEVDTNLAVKIVGQSCDTESFKALTNSFQSIQIDEAALRAAVEATKPNFSTNILEKVEVGFMQQSGAQVVAFVFHCKGKFYSFVSNGGALPDQIIEEIEPWVEKLRDSSLDDGIRRIVVVEAPRGSCHFIMEPVSVTLADLNANSVRPNVGVFTDEWENEMPEGFRPVAEYPVNAELIFSRRKQ